MSVQTHWLCLVIFTWREVWEPPCAGWFPCQWIAPSYSSCLQLWPSKAASFHVLLSSWGCWMDEWETTCAAPWSQACDGSPAAPPVLPIFFLAIKSLIVYPSWWVWAHWNPVLLTHIQGIPEHQTPRASAARAETHGAPLHEVATEVQLTSRFFKDEGLPDKIKIQVFWLVNSQGLTYLAVRQEKFLAVLVSTC